MAVVVDFNNFLLCLHNKGSTMLPPDLSTMYFSVVQEDKNITYYVCNDAKLFLLALSQFAEVYIWTGWDDKAFEKAMARCLPLSKRCLSGWLSQTAFHVCTWRYDNPFRPMYLKTLDALWHLFPNFSSENTLVLDVSLYKMYFNDPACYVILLELQKQSEVQWETFSKEDVVDFVLQWAESDDRA